MSDQQMAKFLASVEQRAYRMALFAVHNRDDALDIVQDAMLQLVQRYGARTEQEWAPLFYRIVQNRITDTHRKKRWAKLMLTWREEADEHPTHAEIADTQQVTQADHLQQSRAMQRLQSALQNLPHRQQQAYLLRHWEGLDVKQTALAMRCSEGSVKTHLSRALSALRNELAEEWP
jgi:RNA polymerase sigma-70 factor, ECF subfamily